MHIGLLIVELHLDGCRSLKEKRSRLSGIRERLGRNVNLAVAETDHQDVHDLSQWSFVAVSGARHIVDQALERAEEYCDTQIDAQLTGAHREYL
jgi:hypothetical protein